MIHKDNIDHKLIKKTTTSTKKIPATVESGAVIQNSLDEAEKTETSSKIKYLPPSVMKDIEQKNAARKLAGLPPILTRIRRCLTCGTMFQSAGNRTCGCTNRIAGVIAGREII